jgi:hypothetical protein
MAATDDAAVDDSADEMPAEKLERIADAISRVDGCLAEGDLKAAVGAAQDEQEWLADSECGLCQRLGVGLVGVTMWVRAMPNVSEDAEQQRIEAARVSLVRQYEQILTEIEAGV